MSLICARLSNVIDVVDVIIAPSAERRAPSAERHDCASGAGASRPALAA